MAALLAIASVPATLHGAESSCERSGSKATPSPDGQWVVNVQQETGRTPWGPAAGVTVILASTRNPARCQYVYVMAVPRSRDDWPRIRWNGPSALEVRVSRLSNPSTGSRVQHPRRVTGKADPHKGPEREYEGIRITVTYCDDNAAGVRPPGPEEPHLAPDPCSD
jgi:hypothetical protein